ncbi:MAG TPA: serine hydrolase [archaeon]|nr:serine hydrolase [archaeon]
MQFKELSLTAVLILGCVISSGLAADDSSTENGDYYPPPESTGGWRKNTDPEFIRSLGLDPAQVEEFGRYNLEVPNGSWMPYANYKGIILIKNGWIVGEWYNIPEAETFKTYISSNGKSFAIVCFGIMAQDSKAGKIGIRIDAWSKVYDPQWLPEGFPLSDSLKKYITFEQIFCHTSGLCPERTASGEDVEQGRNEWTDYTAWVTGRDKKWPQTAKLYFRPGHSEDYEGKEIWGDAFGAYSSVGFCHLGLVFQNVYGIPAGAFLWNRLLEPLGFSGIDFHAPPSKEIKWFSAGGVRITLRDYARFAYFLLRDGRWRQEQIVPQAWIRKFRQSPLYANIRSNADSYFGGQYPKDMFRIAGSGLNWAFIIPSMDLIALRTSRGNNEIWDEVQQKFLQQLFAAVLDRESKN